MWKMHSKKKRRGSASARMRQRVGLTTTTGRAGGGRAPQVAVTPAAHAIAALSPVAVCQRLLKSLSSGMVRAARAPRREQSWGAAQGARGTLVLFLASLTPPPLRTRDRQPCLSAVPSGLCPRQRKVSQALASASNGSQGRQVITSVRVRRVPPESGGGGATSRRAGIARHWQAHAKARTRAALP